MNCPLCKTEMLKCEVSQLCKLCGFAMPFTYRGRRISEKEKEELFVNKKTNWRGGWSKKNAKGTLDGRLVLQENTLTFEAKTLSAKCPKCKNRIYKDGKKWRCGGEDCGFYITQIIFGRKFAEAELEKLLTFGYSDDFDDFVSSKGKFFRGFVEFDEDGETRIRFL